MVVTNGTETVRYSMFVIFILYPSCWLDPIFSRRPSCLIYRRMQLKFERQLLIYFDSDQLDQKRKSGWCLSPHHYRNFSRRKKVKVRFYLRKVIGCRDREDKGSLKEKKDWLSFNKNVNLLHLMLKIIGAGHISKKKFNLVILGNG